MTPQFRLTEPAIQDIETIAEQIAQQSDFDRADQFLMELDQKFAKILKFPRLGRQRDEILPTLRSFPSGNYLILYMPIGQDIEILRVVSGYRDLPALFDDA